MADRTSAALFAQIFETLAELQKSNALSPIIAKDVAAKFWPLTADYDFNSYQMSCDKALLALGLAKWRIVGANEKEIVYADDPDFGRVQEHDGEPS